MSKYCVFLDAGHGGINPQGKYTTAPSKQWRHSSGTYHIDSTFCEGVKNRKYCEKIYEFLTKAGIKVYKVYHPYLDLSLTSRTSTANSLYKQGHKGIYVSEHSNAFNTKARGWCIFTSPGNTKSDEISETIYTNFLPVAESLDIQMRKDITDGDYDLEADFHVLRETIMPAVLIENLFFDNKQDADLLMNEDYFVKYCENISQSIVSCLSNLKL